jgi:DNA-binding response OmpR family regulator
MDKKILVVDDHPSIHVLMKHILGELKDPDFDLLLASDGQKGLELALDKRPNLVFLDVTLPYLSGYEVCRRIKAAHSKTRVILLTGETKEEQHRTAEAGADGYIVKPFYPDQIIKEATYALGLGPGIEDAVNVD